MSEHTGIEWTDATWNPVTGCTKVSPACAHCYIERTPPFRTNGRRFVKGRIPIELHENRLGQPYRWKEPRRIFVNSLSDLFHEDIPFSFIAEVFTTMGQTRRHVYQVLTKRPERLLEFYRWNYRDLPAEQATEDWLGSWPNVWLGVSAENQHWADARIPILLQVPASVHFISAEPLLSEIDLRYWLFDGYQDVRHAPGLKWVIGGAESGSRRRQTAIDWARSLRDQCVAAGVAFFWKQNGGPTPKSGGRLLDGREWSEFPEWRSLPRWPIPRPSGQAGQ